MTIKVCVVCDIEFWNYPSSPNNRFCSKKCDNQWRISEEGKTFYNSIWKKRSNNLVWRSKISNALKGKKRSGESNMKNRLAHIGIKQTEEHKKNAVLGRFNKSGFKHSPETKEKIRAILIQRHKEGRFKNAPIKNKGYRCTEETKEKIRTARMKQKFPSKETSIEKKLFIELKKRNIVFEKNKNILNLTQPDIFIEPNICIYADGDYWHKYPDGLERDKKQNRVLGENGFKVLRFWECDINKNVESCITKIIETINGGI